ncbi:MAG: VOC family protein, partial [Halobacteriota archaeon]
MSKVMFFELPADDPKRAIAFYEKVFGWTITKWNAPMDYWLVTAGS